MTQPGRAAIEIVGDVGKLGRQVERDAQRALDRVELDTDKLSTEIADGFEAGAAQGLQELEEIAPDVEALFDKIAGYAQDASEEVALHFEEGGVRIVRSMKKTRDESKRTFKGIGDDSDTATEAVGTVGRTILSTFSKVGDVLSSIGSKITGSIGALIDPSSLITLGLQTVAFAALTSTIVGLGAALADLAGFAAVLPAIIGAAGSAAIVGAIAFQGLGDALQAVIKGDPEVIAEALKKLAPAAREVVLEFQKLLPLFRQVGDSIQQEFFEPLVGIVEQFGEVTLPRLRNELDVLAQSMGRAFGHLGDLATDTENVAILERLLASTARITDELGAAVASLGQAFLNAIDAGLPSLETLSSRLSGAIESFATFINGAIEDGSFQAFLDDAIATFDELMGFVGALGELLGVLFGSTDDAGRDFIGTLTDLTQRMTEFFKSADGQRVLERVVDSIKMIGQIAGFVVNGLVWMGEAGNDLIDTFKAIGDFFNRAGNDIARFWDGVVGTTSSATSSVGDFFSDLWDKITTVWEGIVDGVSSAIDSVVEFFQSLPDRIVGFVESIPGRIMAVFDAMLDGIITAFGFAIGAVIVLFTDLPGQVAGALNQLVLFLTAKWEEIKSGIATLVSSVITFFEELPAELGRIGSELITWAGTTWNSITTTIGEAVGTAIAFVRTLPARFGQFFAEAYAAVRDKVIAMVEFVKTIPAKIGAALGNVGKMLYESGAKIINGLIDGIASRIGQLRQKIVDAVQQIRDHLPFSPAKVGPLSGAGSPDLAGATIARMIADGLNSGLPLLYGAASRAAGAVADAGITPLTSAAPGQPSVLQPTQTTVQDQQVIIVQIGNEEIEAYIEKRVDARVDTEVRRLMSGSRGI